MSYRKLMEKVAPPWLRGPNGTSWLKAAGDCKDELADRARQAIKARLPGYAPPDAMQAIGEERGVERLPGDTNADYAARVQAVWEKRRWAGTPRGLLEALADIGYPTARLMIHRGRDYCLSAGAVQTYGMTSERWVMDAREGFWSQFEVFFPAPHPWAAPAGVVFQPGPLHSDGLLIPGGTPYSAHVVSVVCSSAGSIASGAAKIDAVIDGHTATGVTVPSTGIMSASGGLEWTMRGALAVGDSWSWTSGVLPFDPDASQDVLRIRRVICRWKPAWATCRGIVIHTAGDLHGWPHQARPERTRGGSSSNNRVIWSA